MKYNRQTQRLKTAANLLRQALVDESFVDSANKGIAKIFLKTKNMSLRQFTRKIHRLYKPIEVS